MAFNSMIILFCLVFHIFSLQTCYCQNNSPQNIETFYPNQTSPSSPPTNQPPKAQPPSLPPQGPIAVSKSSSSNGGKIAKFVAATAAITIVICGLIFILAKRCLRKRKRSGEINNIASDGDRQQVVVPKGNVFERIDGNVRGLIVDEDGLDVIYWRKLEEKNSNKDLYKNVLNSPKNKEVGEDSHEENQVKKSKSIQEIPLLRGKSSASHIFQEEDDLYRIPRIQSQPSTNDGVQKQGFQSQPSILPSISAAAAPPAPPPIPARKSQAPPPPPPMKTSILTSSSKAIPQSNQRNSSGKGMMQESNNDQVKLKPLHWDKVNTNAADHSMVWDKVDRGSFR